MLDRENSAICPPSTSSSSLQRNMKRDQVSLEVLLKRRNSCSDTVLSHLKANKLGRFADVPTNLAHPPPPPSSAPSNVAVGARCQVASEGGLERRGTVRYVGTARIGKGGVWVGVELDEPFGKGDGE